MTKTHALLEGGFIGSLVVLTAGIITWDGDVVAAASLVGGVALIGLWRA